MPDTVILTMRVELRERLGKAIALLGSSVDGEVVAARDTMKRLLETAGLDFNAFADWIATGQQLETSDLVRIITAQLRGMVREARAGAWALAGPEQKFLREFEQRLDRSHNTTTWNDFVYLSALCRAVRLRTQKRN